MRPVVGIDTKSAGFHWFANQEIQGERFGWFLSRLSDQERQAEVLWAAQSFFEGLPPDTVVFVEEPIVLPKNIVTTRKLIEAATTVWCGFQSSGADAAWVWVNVSTWRKSELGRGVPPKGTKAKDWIQAEAGEHVGWQAAIREIPSLAVCQQSQQDLLEAYLIQLYGVRQLAK